MSESASPYHQGNPARLRYAPFAGRQEAMARVAALLADPGRADGLLFLGVPGIGKTALLHAIAAALPDAFVPVYLPLQPLDSPAPGATLHETAWLLALAEAITAALVDRAFTLSRLEQIEPPGDDPRGWFEVTFLPPIFGALRGDRPLVWLIDDADRLVAAVRAGTQSTDLFAWLSALLGRARTITVILTADDAIEGDLAMLAPLIGMNDTLRLAPLGSDDLRWLLTAPVAGAYTLTESALTAAATLTGGFPALAQSLGVQLYRRWQAAPEIESLTSRDVNAMQPSVYLTAEESILTAWERLTPNERIVLAALAGLHYDDPLRRANAESIQRWLTSGESPLDITTIQTALRALEYRHWLTLAAEGAALRSAVQLQWLLANASARIRVRTTARVESGERPRRYSRDRQSGRDGRGHESEAAPIPRRALRWLVIAFVVVLLANAVAFAVTRGTPALTVEAPPPTVTLVAPGGG
ncbi:MAG: ATP-binding protein [Chloroflexota bacterium]|nr:ATP-binding protein [Chloroflexota bacterium]